MRSVGALRGSLSWCKKLRSEVFILLRRLGLRLRKAYRAAVRRIQHVSKDARKGRLVSQRHTSIRGSCPTRQLALALLVACVCLCLCVCPSFTLDSECQFAGVARPSLRPCLVLNVVLHCRRRRSSLFLVERRQTPGCFFPGAWQRCDVRYNCWVLMAGLAHRAAEVAAEVAVTLISRRFLSVGCRPVWTTQSSAPTLRPMERSSMHKSCSTITRSARGVSMFWDRMLVCGEC